MMTSVTQSNRVKIGIRPTIDGRRMGVRESLEEQTMQMAKSVAELLQNHIRHADFRCSFHFELVHGLACFGNVDRIAVTVRHLICSPLQVLLENRIVISSVVVLPATTAIMTANLLLKLTGKTDKI